MKLAVIQTTLVTVDAIQTLVHEILPGAQVINFMDDSILPILVANGGDVSAVAERMIAYARFAEQSGADVILEACSSIGELVPSMREHVSIPVVRIDEAMAEIAVQRARRIGVAATLGTTLRPTLALLRTKAAEAGREIELTPLLVSEAYQKLIEGDREGHDNTLLAALMMLAASVDLVVLAQASMARVLPGMPENVRAKFMSSPRLAVERVKQMVVQHE
jgi:aspartate/glutamate racemase